MSVVSFAGFKLASTAPDPAAPPSVAKSNLAMASVASPALELMGPQLYRVDPHVGPVIRREPTSTGQELLIPTVPAFREFQHSILPGETISQVFSDAGVSANEAEAWIQATRKVYNLNKIFVGQKLAINVDTATDEIVSLKLEVDADTNLVARRKDGNVVATLEDIDLDRNLRVVEGRITSSFYVAATEAEVPDAVISEVADILGWDLNFTTDVRPGAEFRIVYEELLHGTSGRKTPGRVLAVQIHNRGRAHEGILYEKDGRDAYYGRDGQSLGRDFLRYPVAFTRISSVFSYGRFHPILHRNRPHYGVDFAAPVGTPVRSVADGRVELAGWQGGNGRFVKVRHDSTYQSGYAHLSRIASGIKPGTYVHKGQVVGYVGTSGLSTGPHLHFVMYKSGQYINPLSTSMPVSKSLSGPDLAKFKKIVGGIDQVYAKAEATGGAVVVASTDVAALAGGS